MTEQSTQPTQVGKQSAFSYIDSLGDRLFVEYQQNCFSNKLEEAEVNQMRSRVCSSLAPLCNRDSQINGHQANAIEQRIKEIADSALEMKTIGEKSPRTDIPLKDVMDLATFINSCH